MTEEYDKLYTSLVHEKKKEPILESLVANGNMSFGDNMSKNMSRTLDRSSRASVVSSRRSKKLSAFVKKNSTARSSAHAQDQRVKKFNGFRLPPKRAKKKAPELLQFSKRRVIS